MLIILLSFGIFAYNSKSSVKIQIIIAYNNKKILFIKICVLLVFEYTCSIIYPI